MGYLSMILYIYVLSLIPSFEGRYAVVVALALGMDPYLSFAVATLGVATLSFLLPLILPYLDDLMEKLSNSRVSFFQKVSRLYLKILTSVRARSKRYVDKYGFYGLIIFVAVPLPGTGVWTGSLAAYIFGIEKRKTIIALLLGGILSNLTTFLPAIISKQYLL